MADRNLAFRALADPTRRDVFERLVGGGKAVGELADELPVSRPAVSQHLKVLKGAGLVIDRAEGTRRVYQIDPAGLGAMRAWLDQFWDTALAAFKAETERGAPPPDRPRGSSGDRKTAHTQRRDKTRSDTPKGDKTKSGKTRSDK
ncbi:MAG TPA: metalloregulator ArsR/SmtB family transcription factor [Pseudomonadales bacterium]|nr:metalloregulator ArsR/SmtB family transcription factor [Pseudomonadales bacterium]